MTSEHCHFVGSEIDGDLVHYLLEGLVVTYGRQFLNPNSDISRSQEIEHACIELGVLWMLLRLASR